MMKKEIVLLNLRRMRNSFPSVMSDSDMANAGMSYVVRQDQLLRQQVASEQREALSAAISAVDNTPLDNSIFDEDT